MKILYWLGGALLMAIAPYVIGILLVPAPASFYLFGCLLVVGILSDYAEKPGTFLNFLAKTTLTVLTPIVLALLVLYICTILLNFVFVDLEAETVGAIESGLIVFNDFLERWLNPTWWQFTLAFLVLIALAYWKPDWQVVTRFSRLKQRLTQGAAILATLTSFTFITNQALLQPAAREARRHVALLYNLDHQRQQKAAATFVAIQSVQQTLGRLDAEEKQYNAGVIATIHGLKAIKQPARVELAYWVAQQQYRYLYPDTGPSASAFMDGELTSESPAVKEAPRELAQKQRQRTLRAESATNEARKGLEAFFSAQIGAVSGELKGLAGSYVSGLCEVEALRYAEPVKNYLNELTDQLIERLTGPMVEKRASLLDERFRLLLAKYPSGVIPKVFVHSVAEDLVSDNRYLKEAEYCKRQAEKFYAQDNREMGDDYKQLAVAYRVDAEDQSKRFQPLFDEARADALLSGDPALKSRTAKAITEFEGRISDLDITIKKLPGVSVSGPILPYFPDGRPEIPRIHL